MSHPQYPMSSKELLKYVLESAPKGSLKDLSGIANTPTSKDTKIGEGGFADVYVTSAKIKGKIVVIKLLRINGEASLHCKGRYVVRVSSSVYSSKKETVLKE